jgi:hypothetical protein
VMQLAGDGECGRQASEGASVNLCEPAVTCAVISSVPLTDVWRAAAAEEARAPAVAEASLIIPRRVSEVMLFMDSAF